VATRLRAEAARACEEKRWADRLDALDAARARDPTGDGQPEWRALRARRRGAKGAEGREGALRSCRAEVGAFVFRRAGALPSSAPPPARQAMATPIVGRPHAQSAGKRQIKSSSTWSLADPAHAVAGRRTHTVTWPPHGDTLFTCSALATPRTDRRILVIARPARRRVKKPPSGKEHRATRFGRWATPCTRAREGSARAPIEVRT
jgi:hypothetical protein